MFLTNKVFFIKIYDKDYDGKKVHKASKRAVGWCEAVCGVLSCSSLNPRPKGAVSFAALSRLGRDLPLQRSLVGGQDSKWAAQPSMQSGTAENI